MKRALIVRTGGIGKRHVRGFLDTARVRLSVCEPDQTRRQEVLRDYDIETGYADFAEAPLDPFDLAVVSTPAQLHVPIAQRLADAGVSFLLEKPLSTTLDGVDTLIRTVGEKGLTVRVGFSRRSNPWFVRLREDIRRGRIGRVRMAYIDHSHDYRKYRPDYQVNYFGKKDQGGGAILDLASHHFDLLQWIFGPITEVSAIYDRLEIEGIETEDTALIAVRFADGGMAQININLFQKPYTGSYEFVGTEGNLRVLSAKGQLQCAADDSGEWQTEEFVPPGQSVMEVHEANFIVQANNFLDALEGQPDQLATLEEARDSLRVALAAKESYQTRTIVQL